MTESRTETAGSRPLDILGISEAEERVYDWLLTHSGATVPEIAQVQSLTPGKAQRLLDAIEAKGLITHAPERPRRYIPTAPDIALKALALRHHESLQRAEVEIRKLQERAAAAQQQGGKEQIVELITNREAERQIIEQTDRTARHEILALIRPPMLTSRLDVPPEQDQHTQREAQTRGVHIRSIVDAEFLALPGAVARVHSDMKAGEEVRVIAQLPLKLMLTDHRIAIIPLRLQQPESPSLLVRASALLDALYALFEVLWERAAPISFTPAGALEIGDTGSRLPEETEYLISLMAAGLNDKKIANELDISMRTLRRRTVELMKELNARTRFQTGWVAALRLSGQNLD